MKLIAELEPETAEILQALLDKGSKPQSPAEGIPDGGPTNLNNLVLLCRKHHQIVHRSEWTVRIRGGLPEFIPPKWIDRYQRPVRNKIHLRP